MRKAVLLFIIPLMLVCASCGKAGDNISDSSLSYSSMIVADSNKAETELKNYFHNNFATNDIGILADVTCDDIVDLITVKKEDYIICGKVYTFLENKVQCVEEKTGAHDHAGGFFNWYLIEKDTGYSLVEENCNMWQGIGTCETIIYNLTSHGNRIVKDRIFLTSDAPVSDEEFEKYQENISNVIGNSYDILHIFSESKSEPKSMRENLLIGAGF